jgi:probable HAF family extracellular repeat protein
MTSLGENVMTTVPALGRRFLIFAAVLLTGLVPAHAALIGFSSDTDSYYEIDPATGGAKLITPVNGDFAGTGLSFLEGELYASDLFYSTSPFEFRFTRLDGQFVTIINNQDLSLNWHGLASDETNRVLYSIPGDQGKVLKRIATDGSITTIGTGTGIDGRGLAYDDNHGILYATDAATLSLYTVNTETGVSTLVGPLNLPIVVGDTMKFIGLAYDEQNDVLYANMLDLPAEDGINISRVGSLYVLDTSTGNATLVGSHTGPHEGSNGVPFIDGLAWIEQLEPIPFIGLGDLPGSSFNSITAGISADGRVVVGCSWSSQGFQAFRWTQETGMIGLGDLPGGEFKSCAQAVSGDGQIVVGNSTSGDGQEAFRWTAQTGMVGLGDLPGGAFSSRARGISQDGSVIVGESTSADKSDEAFRWTEGDGMVAIGGDESGFLRTIATDTSSDGSVTVGFGLGGNGWEAIKWLKRGKKQTVFEALGDLPGGDFNSGAGAVSADGAVIAGDGRTDISTTQPARWTKRLGWVELGDLPGGDVWGRCTDLTDDGSVIVGWSKTDLGDEAFIWDETDGMRRLHDVLASDLGIHFPGWTLLSVQGISADGTIMAGDGVNPQGARESWIARLVSDSGDPSGSIPVVIEIKPDTIGDVTIDIKREKSLPVAIITDETFDATQVDAATVRFGTTGTEARISGSSQEDVDSDGDIDLLLTFRTRNTHISCEDTEATLTGATYSGESIVGTDTFTVICP